MDWSFRSLIGVARMIPVGRLKVFRGRSGDCGVEVVRVVGWRNPPPIKRVFCSADWLPDLRAVRCIGTHRQHAAIDRPTMHGGLQYDEPPRRRSPRWMRSDG